MDLWSDTALAPPVGPVGGDERRDAHVLDLPQAVVLDERVAEDRERPRRLARGVADHRVFHPARDGRPATRLDLDDRVPERVLVEDELREPLGAHRLLQRLTDARAALERTHTADLERAV